MQDLWKECTGSEYICPINAEAHRVVESQHRSATRKLVDTLEEHELLETLIEKSKPDIPKDPEFKKLHYLFFTPFRYPPLRHGSRFGSTFERALWYGAFELETALAEVAFYRFYFLLGSSATLELLENQKIVEVELTSFIAQISTKKGIDLTLPPFEKYKDEISSPSSYHISQKLGTSMREASIEAFLYGSARRKNYTNIGLFSPKAFKDKTPKKNSYQSWLCISTKKSVEFSLKSYQKQQTIRFNLEAFLVNEKFPKPY